MENETKTCFKCNEEKFLNEFYKHKNYADGYMKNCKTCKKEEAKNNRQKNPNYIKKWREENKQHVKDYNKMYNENNQEIIKQYKKQCREDNKDKISEYRKKYFQNNKEKINEYKKNKYQNDKNFKIRHIVGNRLNKALKSQNLSKTNHTFDLISCSINELNNWLEFTKPYFIPEDYEGQIHIDHFIPISSFDLNNNEELKKACHWSNLRYLTEEQNKRKSNKSPKPEDKFKMFVLKKFYKQKFSS